MTLNTCLLDEISVPPRDWLLLSKMKGLCRSETTPLETDDGTDNGMMELMMERIPLNLKITKDVVVLAPSGGRPARVGPARGGSSDRSAVMPGPEEPGLGQA